MSSSCSIKECFPPATLIAFCKKGIVSNLIETNEMYPDSVNNHLISEKAVLKIQSVNWFNLWEK